MRSSTSFVSLIAVAALAAFAQIACSSDDNAPAAAADAGTPIVIQDSGSFAFPDSTAGTTVAITGDGSVYSQTAAGDGAPPPVSCTSDGTTTTGTCHAEYQDTLYASPADGWAFDHWEPSGATTQTLFVDESTPANVTAVFVTDKLGQVDGSTPPATDSGASKPDSSTTPDSSTAPDTGTADSGHD